MVPLCRPEWRRLGDQRKVDLVVRLHRCGRADDGGDEGPYLNDVRGEGEGGGWPISDQRKGGSVDLVLTRVREDH